MFCYLMIYFLTICDYFNMTQIIKLELISKYHCVLIRKTIWYKSINIKNDEIFDHIIKHYHFKNLYICVNVNVNHYVDYLQKCHTLDLGGINVNDETVKALKNCHTLFLWETDITDDSIKNLKCHTLDISWTNVTDEGIKNLKCHALDLTATNITDKGVKNLKCRRLTVRKTKVTDACIQKLRSKGCTVYN